jgi:hypothetical protein
VKLDSRIIKSTNKVNFSDGNSLYALIVKVEPNGVKVNKKGGTLIDDFTDSRYEWRRAVVAIKGDAYFVVQDQ